MDESFKINLKSIETKQYKERILSKNMIACDIFFIISSFSHNDVLQKTKRKRKKTGILNETDENNIIRQTKFKTVKKIRMKNLIEI